MGAEAAPKHKRATSTELVRGTTVHRYVVLDRIGMGGMGRVYTAYDPELDRKIALKLLRYQVRDSELAESKRLHREAQALAQLSHPNVVAVHDVGIYEGNIFLAMELIQGKNLRNWLRHEAPSRAQIIDAFVQAGRGLAAAHSAGMVHRDFKPDNVIVGDDGRVRVVDFGLARNWQLRPSQTITTNVENDANTEIHSTRLTTLSREPDNRRRAPTVSYLDSDEMKQSLLKAPLTQAQGVHGTPAYMAPEQFEAIEIDHRADQYSYCVALFEAMCGFRPAKGKHIQAIRRSVTLGDLRRFPYETHVPGKIKRVLKRGLSLHAEDRFESMNALLRELLKDRFNHIRRFSSIGVLVTTIIILLWTLARDRTPSNALCKHAADRVHLAWNHKKKKVMRDVFISSDRAHAARSYERVSALLDSYTNTWSRMRIATCEATYIRKEQSEHLLDLRMQCLDRRLGQMSALVQVLSNQPSMDAIDNAITATYQLPTSELCQNITALTMNKFVPKQISDNQRYQILSNHLDRAVALQSTGNYLDAKEIVENVLRKARMLDYPPFIAEALYVAGSLSEIIGETNRAEELLIEGAKLAASVENDSLHAKIWIALLRTVGYTQARFREAFLLEQMADATIQRSGDDPLLRALLYEHVGSAAWAAGDTNRAYTKHLKSLAIRRSALGTDHPDLAKSLNNLGAAMYRQGRFEEAVNHHLQALTIRISTLGEEHPDTAMSHLNIGVSLVSQRKYDQAHDHYIRSLEIFTHTYNREHSNIGLINNNLGEFWWLQSHYQHAYDRYIKAVSIFERVHGIDHPFMAYPLTGVGQALIGLKKYDEAIEVLQRALHIRSTEQTEPTQLALTEFYLQRAYWQKGNQSHDIMKRAYAAYDTYRNGKNRLAAEIDIMHSWIESIFMRRNE